MYLANSLAHNSIIFIRTVHDAQPVSFLTSHPEPSAIIYRHMRVCNALTHHLQFEHNSKSDGDMEFVLFNGVKLVSIDNLYAFNIYIRMCQSFNDLSTY